MRILRRLTGVAIVLATLGFPVATVSAGTPPVVEPTSSYIVIVASRDDIDDVSADVARSGGSVGSVYRYAVGGFSARLTDS
ncbi:MAG: hypothetical protein FGM42_11605, partial [Ilumatobacteraceae bacterium]|nr:hypothetical protein [Ilumatobacteraceae bacterium]